jgi:hypothetical protein
MRVQRFPTFARFMDCYWNQDSVYSYGDFRAALTDFLNFEHQSECEALKKEIQNLRRLRAFPHKRYVFGYTVPRYNRLLNREFFGCIVTFEEISSVSDLII